jgi:ABC-type transport system substrate-binding protein
MGKDYWSKDVSTIMTNGPYKIETIEYYIVGGEFTLERNLGYHQKNDAVEYTQHVTPNKLMSLVTMGEELTFSNKGDKLNVSIEDLDKTVFYMGEASLEYRKANKDKAIVADDLSVYSYVFNTNKAPFNNKDVRRALSLAIDRDKMIEEIVFGKAANGFLPEAVAKSVYGDNITSRLSSDMDEAKALIDAANLSTNNMKFTLTINKDEQSRKMAEIACEAWEELGFTVTVEEVGYVENTIIDTSTEGERVIIDQAVQNLVKDASFGVYNYDVIAIDWQLYSKDALVSLASFTDAMNGNGANLLNNTSRKNIASWSNNKYNSYINAAFNARNEEARMNALAEAEKILLEEAPIVPVVFNQSFAFASSELTGITFDGFGNIILTKANLNNYHEYLPKKEEK